MPFTELWVLEAECASFRHSPWSFEPVQALKQHPLNWAYIDIGV